MARKSHTWVRYLVCIFFVCYGWRLFLPLATQLWHFQGGFVLLRWITLSLTIFFLISAFYIYTYPFSKDDPKSFFSLIQGIAFKKWLFIATISTIGTPPYLFWVAFHLN